MSSSREATRLHTAACVMWSRSLAARKLPSRAAQRKASTNLVFMRAPAGHSARIAPTGELASYLCLREEGCRRLFAGVVEELFPHDLPVLDGVERHLFHREAVAVGLHG